MAEQTWDWYSVTKIDHSFLGLSSPVLFPGVREPSGASCVGLSFDLG